MDAARFTALESAAFAAWPCLEPEQRDHGWRLRFSGGYTKRANSANATIEAAALSPSQLADIEGRYRSRGLPVIFRLNSFASPTGFDEQLQQRGYRHVDPSLVMIRDVGDAPDAALPTRRASADDWLADFLQISQSSAAGQQQHLRMLQAIRDPYAFAVDGIDEAGVPACCGLGVTVNGYLGLFDIATRREQRRRGLASALCGGLLRWGREHGAHTAYLQVAAANDAAMRVYQALGFRPAYRYWYRVAR